jgi:hypothetical protein
LVNPAGTGEGRGRTSPGQNRKGANGFFVILLLVGVVAFIDPLHFATV